MLGRLVARSAVVVLLVAAPFAGAITAVRFAPPAHVEVVGQDVTIKPVLGRNTTEFEGGAMVRPEHGEIPIVGKPVGLDLHVDLNALIPQDKQTRRALSQLWDDPQPEIALITAAARGYVIRWAAIGFGVVLLLEVGTWLVLRLRRRKLATYSADEARLVVAHNRRLRIAGAALALAAVVFLDVTAARIYSYDDHRTVVGSPVFQGTSMSGTEVNGLVGEVVPFLSVIEPRSDFYDRVSDNLDAALEKTPLSAGHDRVLFVAGEDLEDVNGMARVLGRVAHLTDADFLAYTGDLTFGGKAVESYIIDTINYYAEDTPVEFAPGLHDTDTIVDAARARGWQVADGSTHDVAGITVLSAADPRVSTVGDFGSGTVLRDEDVDVATFVSDLGDEACESHPDVVLLHDHRLGRQIAARGCQSAMVLDGRSYKLIGPQHVATADGHTAVEFTGGSTGGHATTVPDPGRIKNPATLEVFRYDETTGETDYSVVTVRPDASVTVTPWISLQVPYADFLSDGRTEPAR